MLLLGKRELHADGKRGKMFEINVMEGAGYGFAVRGNPGDDAGLRCVNWVHEFEIRIFHLVGSTCRSALDDFCD